MTAAKDPANRSKGKLPEDLFQSVLENVDFEEEIEKLRIVERIIELRKKIGLSRRELAARIGENEAFIEKLETRKVLFFDGPLLIRISHALSCRLEINFRHPDDSRP